MNRVVDQETTLPTPPPEEELNAYRWAQRSDSESEEEPDAYDVDGACTKEEWAEFAAPSTAATRLLAKPADNEKKRRGYAIALGPGAPDWGYENRV